jgi:hypothetical protein
VQWLPHAAAAQARPLLRVLLVWHRSLSARAGCETLLRGPGELTVAFMTARIAACTFTLLVSVSAFSAELFEVLQGRGRPRRLARSFPGRHASDDAYWLSAEDQKNLGYRSPAYDRYLRDKCAWDDQKPVEDLKRMVKCRDRVTQDAARQALALASTIH